MPRQPKKKQPTPGRVSNLVFYAQLTMTVISGQTKQRAIKHTIKYQKQVKTTTKRFKKDSGKRKKIPKAV